MIDKAVLLAIVTMIFAVSVWMTARGKTTRLVSQERYRAPSESDAVRRWYDQSGSY